MSWLSLNSSDQLAIISAESFQTPIVLLKHSTRCSISVMALGRLDRSVFPDTAKFYLLDLLQHRDISAALAEKYNVHHESPQILIIKNDECIYDESHQGIRMEDIVEALG
jgi:bacillithiol system protein YtxJ